MDDFDIAAAGAYWRFAPSGAGKHDTSTLLGLGDQELAGVWDEGFVKRFRLYPEEEQFLRQMSVEFIGKRVLSIGSGLGLHEIYYQLRGADVTCCDIVDTNLAIIGRIAAAKGAEGMRFVHSSGPDHDLGGPYDVVFVYGSLMTMPEALQRRLAGQCLASLAPSGRVVLMLYTWEFARATCGWSSPAEFDPRIFARASDPSVGDEHCPWSDWHDEGKLLRLFGGVLHVSRRQLWNQGWFVWYELRRAGVSAEGAFFDSSAMTSRAEVREIDLDQMQPADAALLRTQAGVAVKTASNSFGYALVGGVREEGETARAANAILVDATIEEGAFSVGILDVAHGKFCFAQAIWQSGRHQHLFAFDRIPARHQAIISNCRRDGPGVSQFVLHRLALFDRTELAAPPNRA